ncbi:hypothetical protein DUNSADRAFT_9239 [Dunaliella salina]|uniref:Encoded protein n=1 Tax=Dunaliella salina TaxID=3046 RepID=A0ABQ7GI39_DUNSA|nr:hypothetical protein DUNSADRAFT_9239 [Dunaliella salina]|eukprot:KAF5834209.1 hypothetical protein DUNSADRAFT_9239 [Dunaliella salina]
MSAEKDPNQAEKHPAHTRDCPGGVPDIRAPTTGFSKLPRILQVLLEQGSRLMEAIRDLFQRLGKREPTCKPIPKRGSMSEFAMMAKHAFQEEAGAEVAGHMVGKENYHHPHASATEAKGHRVTEEAASPQRPRAKVPLVRPRPQDAAAETAGRMLGRESGHHL